MPKLLTNLKRHISSEADARAFLLELWRNHEDYHCESNAFDIEFCGKTATYTQCRALNRLHREIYALSGGDHANPVFDPCQFLLELDHGYHAQYLLIRYGLNPSDIGIGDDEVFDVETIEAYAETHDLTAIKPFNRNQYEPNSN